MRAGRWATARQVAQWVRALLLPLTLGMGVVCVAAATTATAAPASAIAASPLASLRAQYTALQDDLTHNAFKQPLVVRSDEANGKILGEVFAVVEFPLAQVIEGLNGPQHWCDILILHINTKYCSAKPGAQGPQITVRIGKKTPENLIYTRPVVLQYLPHSAGPDYLNIELVTKDGPIGTSDYEIVLEAVALPGDRSFLHLRYAYKINMIGKLALETYLKTAGRNKRGFSMVPGTAARPAELVGGVRGVVERNTVRYYLAIDAYLAAQQRPAADRQEARLLHWIQATERYPEQLEEMDRSSYLEMKRAELIRQKAPL